MANFSISGFDEMEKEILRQSEKAERLAPKMLKAGAGVLVKAQKSELKRIIRTNKSVGTLEKSISAGRVKKSSSSYYIDVYPKGNQPHGNPKKGKRGNVSNAQVGFTLEYGHSIAGKDGKNVGNVPAQAWMSVANKKSAEAVHKAMRDVWESEQD